MRKAGPASVVVSAILALGLTAYLGGVRRAPVTAQAAATRRVAFLITFGVTGGANVDWSGSIEPTPLRMSGWQFETADKIEPARWKCVTREENYWDTPYERRLRPTSNRDKFTRKGVLVEFDTSRGGDVRVTTAQGNFSFSVDAAMWLAPSQFLNGRVEVRSSPVAEALPAGTSTSDDNPSLYEASDGVLWMAYQAHADGGRDRILVRRRAKGAGWSAPETLASSGDYFRSAIAQDKNNRVWVVWSAQESGNFDLFGRSFDGKRWSKPMRLTQAAGSDIFHVMARGNDGKLYLAYQSSRAGNFDIYLRIYDGKRWSEEMQVSSDPANDWEPALATAPDGRVTVLWDTYAKGNYDVMARTVENGQLGPAVSITSSGAFEARASGEYDKQGRLWIAWDEGDFNWGKDYGFAIPETGRGLITKRQTRIAVFENGKLMEPAAPVMESVPEDIRQAFHQPKLALGRDGAPWVLGRYRVNLPKQQGTGEPANRAMWKLGATTYRNGHWTPLIEFPECFGRIDAPASAALSGDGSVQVAWASDGRTWPSGTMKQHRICSAALPPMDAPAPTTLVAYQPPPQAGPVLSQDEAGDVARVRAYRTKSSAGELRIARGDMHRHTDISWDGNRDGSLFDSYRYAMDAAAFDYLGVTDHQAGQSIPYNWWRIQKAVDMFTIPGRFTPLYSYERSLPYPNGHRNVLFATRGNPILEIAPAEQKGTEGAGKLYAYLRKLGGVTMAHTSATGMGTDWRDNDPEVEPAVEIYQGYRASYEGPDSPRQDANESRRFQAGYVQKAWAKGYRLGVQSSSDHVSTHISYAALFVDKLDREALLRALRERRTFAATDNLIVDFSMGDHFMGATFAAHQPEPLKAYIRGTGDIANVTLIKNNRIIYSKPGDGVEMNFSYTDGEVPAGSSYYYLRVEQKNGQLAWSSPIWVKYN